MRSTARPTSRSSALWTAIALSLGAAVSLGLARFSYALMLPAMRADLGWSYLTAGAMNTVNAAGYLLGALLTGRLLDRFPARRLLLSGTVVAGVALVGHGWVASNAALYALRFATGVGSAATFIAGGLLAVRLVAPAGPAASPVVSDAKPALQAGLALGIYYGGTGLGIVASALMLPSLIRPTVHGWQPGWYGLGIAALLAAAVMAVATRRFDVEIAARGKRGDPGLRRFAPALLAYFLFGLGYIGYMTFVITLLRELRLPAMSITAFYVALGVAVCVSSWLWAELLQRCRGGEAMTLLIGLLAAATLGLVVSAHPVAVFASGVLFGAVFVSVVAATTALVRHNLEPAAWSGGIAGFTTVFAAGQIVGPALVGWVADAAGGLRSGFAFSAAALVVAASMAWRQKPLGASPGNY